MRFGVPTVSLELVEQSLAYPWPAFNAHGRWAPTPAFSGLKPKPTPRIRFFSKQNVPKGRAKVRNVCSWQISPLFLSKALFYVLARTQSLIFCSEEVWAIAKSGGGHLSNQQGHTSASDLRRGLSSGICRV